MPLVEGILLSLDFHVGTPPALYTLGFSRPLLTQQHASWGHGFLPLIPVSIPATIEALTPSLLARG